MAIGVAQLRSSRSAMWRGGSTASGSRSASRPPGSSSRQAAWRLTCCFVALVLGVWAFAPFVLVALDAARHGRVFLGVDGQYPMDGLQYLAWVRDAASHGMIRNLFGSAGGAVFLHPMWTVSGLVQAATGVSSAVILGFWKAVSVGVLFAGGARLVSRYVPPQMPGRRAAALCIGLFGGLTLLAGSLVTVDPGQAGSDFQRVAATSCPRRRCGATRRSRSRLG